VQTPEENAAIPHRCLRPLAVVLVMSHYGSDHDRHEPGLSPEFTICFGLFPCSSTEASRICLFYTSIGVQRVARALRSPEAATALAGASLAPPLCAAWTTEDFACRRWSLAPRWRDVQKLRGTNILWTAKLCYRTFALVSSLLAV
jgi:hypothetical protein